VSIVIDPTFSVYHLVQRTQQQKHFIRHRQTMLQISFAVEDAVLEAGRSTRLFAGFQQLSKFLPQVERYRKLATTVESIYVFGIADVEPPPIDKVTYVRVSPDDRLSKEWFVACYGRNYSSILATEEITKITDPEEKRLFNGVWTFNPLIVSIIGDWISSAVDAKPLHSDVSDLTHEVHVQTMIRTIQKIIGQISQDDRDMPSPNSRLASLRQELETTLKEELEPQLTKTI
jgi:hypothetical protein